MKRKWNSFPDLASGDDGELPGAEFEVFLNFGELDTCLGFTDCLYHAMDGAGVHVFRDEEGIQKGEEIGGELLHAIDNSKVYVTIFSRDYASSAECLRELAHIMKRYRGSSGKVILPIFYNVGAHDVELQTGVYDEALKEHEDRFGSDVVQRWKEALIEVARIEGWDLKDKGEGAVIKQIVDEVLTRLKKRQRNLPDHLIGIHDHFKDMTCLLQKGSPDVRFVVIHGMGGIGKTTLAEAVFNQISHQFCGHSFLSNVRESSQDDKIRELQWRLLSDILKFRPPRIYEANDGVNMLKKRFRHKKVLIVLDDIDNRNQLMTLAGKHDWFGPGSRIIITTRDIRSLSINKGRPRDSDCIQHGEFYTYEMKEMPLHHALQLFSEHAFRRATPPTDYANLATKIVKTTGGFPLALKVIGSSLCYKSEAVWEDTLEKLIKMPQREGTSNLNSQSRELQNLQERLVFKDRESLVEIDLSIANQEHLQCLEIRRRNRLGSLLEEASTEIGPCGVPQSLPDSMGNLRFLTTLKMVNLELFELPETIGKLKSLLQLELGGMMKISGLPHFIGDLKMLRKMVLYRAPIEKVPDSIGGLESLIELNLENTDIIELPTCIGN
ncbi:hypothetical protein BT93_L1168 [Corymbia citriodora subsp. variegata]|uniref:TIR domain-containing protein n=1 Tax=Corymbia citriodora subsp. variegata TaxID=360336 RepID=A0A8T0CNL8_CORYI|nr:hypothetical protein BT93_L1168 [Corymbia citriodora subsp. variegata]